MNASQLIELLSQVDPSAEVRVVHQPSYPVQFNLAGIASSFDFGEGSEEDAEAESTEAGEIVWIATGDHPDNPYGPDGAWDVARKE